MVDKGERGREYGQSDPKKINPSPIAPQSTLVSRLLGAENAERKMDRDHETCEIGGFYCKCNEESCCLAEVGGAVHRTACEDDQWKDHIR